MSKILIVGNVLKDVYLKMDERKNDFELDERGVSWLDLGFNGEAHSFFRRTAVYGGAAVSLAVLNGLGLDAGILNNQSEMKAGEIIWSGNAADYRYIFCNQNGITYFVPSERVATDWAMPKGTPEWILADRSTNVGMRLVDELASFLKFSPSTKLAVHAEKHQTAAGQRLAEMADLLFVEDEPPVRTEEKIVDKIELDVPNTQLVCHISPRRLSLGEAEEFWSLERADMMTHLTVYSTIVATILGVIAAGGSPADALLTAKLNAEHATLDGALSAERLRELAKVELEKRANLKLIARSLMNAGKGVLAADESERTLSKRLMKFDIPNTTKKRREFYELLLATPRLRDGVNGVILSPEVARMKLPSGRSVLEFLTDRGIIPGVKADQGLLEQDGELVTLGEDGLAERLRNYYNAGFRFAKWRAAFEIDAEKPGFFAVSKNAELLAGFARECQLAGMVPLVEVDVLREGEHGIEQCADVTVRVLNMVFEKLAMRRVDLAGCVLKCNMISAGAETGEVNVQDVGMATAAILRSAVPRHLGGVLLLSGGLEAKVATKCLTAVMQSSPFPWPVSFAFSRALEEPVLATWKGEDENVKAAQAALMRHLDANVDALHYGKVERLAAGDSENIEVLNLG